MRSSEEVAFINAILVSYDCYYDSWLECSLQRALERHVPAGLFLTEVRSNVKRVVANSPEASDVIAKSSGLMWSWLITRGEFELVGHMD